MAKKLQRTTTSPARLAAQAEQAARHAEEPTYIDLLEQAEPIGAAQADHAAYAAEETKKAKLEESDGVHESSEVDDRYSRNAATSRYVNAKQKQRKRSSMFTKVLVGLLIVAALAGIGAFGYAQWINSRLTEGVDSSVNDVLVETNLTQEPFYMLLLGTDESIDRNENMSTDGIYRTDTIILTRIDPIKKQVTLVSMQRDTQVDLPGYGKQKLNAAYTFGGPELAISTVSSLAGVGISHFVLIDMNGLQDVVDALGGIDVNVPMDIWDDDAGGYLPAGEQTLNGWEALILCRARNAYSDYGNGDVYRAANQRLVIQAIANKLLASDVGTIANTVGALSGAVQTDLQVNDIVGLAQAFQGMDTENNIWTGSMPTESFFEDELWFERIIEPDWTQMMQRVDSGLPPTEDSSIDFLTGTVLANAGSAGKSGQSGKDLASKTGTIAVRNGSGVDGLAATVQKRLEAQGYMVSDIGDADSFNYSQTVVVYEDPDRAEEAADIVAVLGEGRAEKNNLEYIMSEDFLVVIGKDYANNTDE